MTPEILNVLQSLGATLVGGGAVWSAVKVHLHYHAEKIADHETRIRTIEGAR